MTNYYKIYTLKDSPYGIAYVDLYGYCSATAILVGSFASNFFSVFLINLLGEENPMTIPYVCMARHFIDIPAVAMIFLVQDNFFVSIGGFFL